MKLICKKNSFTRTKKIGLSLLSRQETETATLPLTVGQAYEVQIASRINKDNLGSILSSNMFLETEVFLWVFTDKKIWEAITISQVFPDAATVGMDELNRMMQTLFENP